MISSDGAVAAVDSVPDDLVGDEEDDDDHNAADEGKGHQDLLPASVSSLVMEASSMETGDTINLGYDAFHPANLGGYMAMSLPADGEESSSSGMCGPSSVEAQADPNDLELSNDLGDFDDIPDVPDETGSAAADPDYPFFDLFPTTDPGTATPSAPPNANTTTEALESGNCDVPSLTGVGGVCGLRNVGNTCYMNAGLQCLCATPTVADFFIRHFDQSAKSATDEPPSLPPGVEADPDLTRKFGLLLRSVWSGEFSLLRPSVFKDALGETQPQFRGSHQHDCQEFLALMLDHMHEDLKVTHKVVNRSECGTSMELHTSHSLEKDEGSVTAGAMHKEDALAAAELDGSESRGSASPKSFDSNSSVDDKLALSIRHMPVPDVVKTRSGGDECAMDEDNDDTMDSSASAASSGVLPTSNLVPNDLLMRKHNVVRFSDAVLSSSEQNNEGAISIDDYIKDTKTLNVNVLADEVDEQMNNEVNFDSEKFSRHHEKLRPRETIDNLNPGDEAAFDKKCANVKRIKETNIMLEDKAAIEFNAIKRMRLDSVDKEKNVQLEMERQKEQGANNVDLAELACSSASSSASDDVVTAAGTSSSGSGSSNSNAGSGSVLDTRRLKEAVDADRYWEKYLSLNDTVVARSFQGQFKNTVVCSHCGYVSVSFEPFMYLPVPLPNALLRQIEVTLVSARSVTTYLLDMTQASKVTDLKRKMAEVVLGEDAEAAALEAFVGRLQAVEVLDHHISRHIEDWCALKHFKDDREVCLIEVLGADTEAKPAANECEVTSTSEWGPSEAAVASSSVREGGDAVMDECTVSTSAAADFEAISSSSGAAAAECLDFSEAGAASGQVFFGPCLPEVLPSAEEEEPEPSSSSYASCVICMEELCVTLVRQHSSCPCVMCSACIERSIDHHESANEADIPKAHIRCPGCREVCDPATEFVAQSQLASARPRLRSLNLAVVFRTEFGGEVSLFGYPTSLRVTNVVDASAIHAALQPIIRVDHGYNLVLVDAVGKHCARCIFNSHCAGCARIPTSDESGSVLLQASDTIAVTYNLAEVDAKHLYEEYAAAQDPSLAAERAPLKLTLESCLEAFSTSETLDSSNPWFCPVCRKNQCATKTLTVWRFPDFLIVYLKRFIFMNSSACALKLEKPVEFRLSELDLTPFLSGPLQTRPVFDLYSVVNHFGSVGGGHYTAACRHPTTAMWNYFDDDNVRENHAPGASTADQAAAYILFYQRSGASDEIRLPSLKTDNALAMKASSACADNVDDEDDAAEAKTEANLTGIIRSLDTPPPPLPAQS